MEIFWVLFLVAYFILLALIGYYASKKVKTYEDFSVVGRKAKDLHVGLHFAASYISAATVVGLMSWQYQYGWSYLAFYTAGMAFGWLILHVLGERFRTRIVIGHTTADFFAMRYYSNKSLRLWVAINYLWLLTVFMIIQYMGIGTVSEVVLGIPYTWATLLVGVPVTIYVAIGGSWAVMYTDIFQALIMWAGVILMAPALVSICGGLEAMNTRLAQISPALIDITAGGVFPPMVIAHLFTLGALATASQAYYHRMFFMCPNRRVAKAVIGIGGPMCLVFYISLMLSGVAVRALAPGIKPDMAFPYTVKELLPVYLSMFMIGAIYAAIMSTVDTILLAVTMHVANDIIMTIKPASSERKTLLIARSAALVVGFIAMTLAVLRPAGIMDIYIFYGVALPSFVFVPLFGGYFWKRATKEAAFASSIVGLVTSIVWHGPLKQPYLPTLFVSLPLSAAAFVVVSLLTPPPPQETIKKFFEV
ncbi:MAG: sodium:solute symporter family protein [Ignisphaera sp.]